MNFDWKEYLVLAESLQENHGALASSEASLRSATSRAYYAAFQCALNFAKKEGFRPSFTGNDHGTVRKHFRNHKTNKTRNKISVELDRMYKNRGQADYDQDLRTSPSNLAYYTINMAKSVLENLDSLEQA